MTHRVEIEPTTLGERGPRYRVTYGNAVLIEGTRNPELDACRRLLGLGLTGRLEVWRKGKTHPDVMIADITRGAQLTVEEGDRHSARFVPWRPRDAGLDSVSRSAVSARAADCLSGAGEEPSEKSAILPPTADV
jgi:hypothetical protein